MNNQEEFIFRSTMTHSKKDFMEYIKEKRIYFPPHLESKLLKWNCFPLVNLNTEQLEISFGALFFQMLKLSQNENVRFYFEQVLVYNIQDLNKDLSIYLCRSIFQKQCLNPFPQSFEFQAIGDNLKESFIYEKHMPERIPSQYKCFNGIQVQEINEQDLKYRIILYVLLEQQQNYIAHIIFSTNNDVGTQFSLPQNYNQQQFTSPQPQLQPNNNNKQFFKTIQTYCQQTNDNKEVKAQNIPPQNNQSLIQISTTPFSQGVYIQQQIQQNQQFQKFQTTNTNVSYGNSQQNNQEQNFQMNLMDNRIQQFPTQIPQQFQQQKIPQQNQKSQISQQIQQQQIPQSFQQQIQQQQNISQQIQQQNFPQQLIQQQNIPQQIPQPNPQQIPQQIPQLASQKFSKQFAQSFPQQFPDLIQNSNLQIQRKNEQNKPPSNQSTEDQFKQEEKNIFSTEAVNQLSEETNKNIQVQPRIITNFIQPKQLDSLECTICNSNYYFELNEAIMTPCCNQKVHAYCYQQHLNQKAKESMDFEKITCYCCFQSLKKYEEFLKNNISISLICEIIKIKVLSDIPMRCFKCKLVIKVSDEILKKQVKIQCSECKAMLCSLCRQEYHGENLQNQSCPTIQKEIQKAFKGMPILVCPFCQLFQTKDDKCNHVKCYSCKKELCAACSVDRIPILAHGNHYHREGCPDYKPWEDKKGKIIKKVEFDPKKCQRCKETNNPCQYPISLLEYKKQKQF